MSREMISPNFTTLSQNNSRDSSSLVRSSEISKMFVFKFSAKIY